MNRCIRRMHVVRAVALSFVLVCCEQAAVGQQTPEQQLESAIQLYEEGDYVGAEHALRQLDPRLLDDEGSDRLAEYLQRAMVASSMQEKADRDLDAARLAVEEGRFGDARQLLKTILDNEYAASATRAEASEVLRDVNARLATGQEGRSHDMVEAPAEPASGGAEAADGGEEAGEFDAEKARQLRRLRAKALTRDATAALDAGRAVEAGRLFNKALRQVPGYPEAVEGLARLKQHEQVEREAGALIDRIKERNAVAWQRTVTSFRAAERDTIEHVLANRFDLAKQAMLRAKQIVESGKRFADPVARYEALRHDAEALERYVKEEEQLYNERVIAEQRAETLQQNTERIREMREVRRKRIESLMDQAIEHRQDGELESAIHVLQQVLAVEPNNKPARWLKESLEDRQAYARQREQREQLTRQTQGVLIDVAESKIPWWQDLTFPKNWLEIINRPTRAVPGSEQIPGVDSDLQSRLDRKMPIDFDGAPFGEVMQALADANEMNVSVVWGDLAAAGVKRDDPVHLHFDNPVPVRTILREVLDQVGGAKSELGYLPTDGVVKVATRERLDRQVYEVVYNVSELLMPVPNFDDAPTMDLSDPASFARFENGYAGGSAAMFPENYAGESEMVQDEADKLIDLIRQTVEPDSWRERGGTIGSITELNGQLVITQTPTGHARVGGLLSRLREQRAIQVAVEARFITVQSNYLEELGLDLDVVLNSGNAGFDFVPGPGGSRVVDPVLGSRLLLPRSFSRLGFTPSTPGVGTALPVQGGADPIAQPFTQPGLVPQRGNGFVGSQNTTPIPLVNNVLGFTDPGGLTSDLPGSFAGNPTLQPALSIFGSFLDNIQVDFLIRATQADSRTSLLTAPRLVLFNGQRAWVAVVNQQSFVSSLQPVVDADGGAQPLIQTIETGAVLDAQTVVSADRRYVTMTLRPSVGRLLGIQVFRFSVGAAAGDGPAVQLPNISRQVIRTTVTVPDGGTLLIGGQKLAGEIEVESGVPILSKIPILKRLYSSKTLVKDEQVLLILIKPKIIIQSEAEQEAFPTLRS